MRRGDTGLKHHNNRVKWKKIQNRSLINYDQVLVFSVLNLALAYKAQNQKKLFLDVRD